MVFAMGIGQAGQQYIFLLYVEHGRAGIRGRDHIGVYGPGPHPLGESLFLAPGPQGQPDMAGGTVVQIKASDGETIAAGALECGRGRDDLPSIHREIGQVTIQGDIVRIATLGDGPGGSPAKGDHKGRAATVPQRPL